MTLTPANAKKMRFTLRYPPDKILGSFTGSFSAGGMSVIAKRTISSTNHNLGNFVYLQMRFSTDGGTTWYDQHSQVQTSSGGVPADVIQVGCYSTATQISLVASNYTASPITVTWEAVAFAVPGLTYSALPTLGSGNSNFVFSGRYNVQKIYAEATQSLTITSSGATIQTYTLATHSLGYIPTCRIFYTLNSSELWPLSPNQYVNDDFSVKCHFYGNALLTSSLLQLRMVNDTGANASVSFQYRVYLDG